MPNESGGYPYRILGKQVEFVLGGGAGANHITEELVINMVEHARKKGVRPDSKAYPIRSNLSLLIQGCFLKKKKKVPPNIVRALVFSAEYHPTQVPPL